jgi:hypothetical protein
VSADEYGFRPLPPEGLTIWEKVGILAGLLVMALAGLTIALNCQLNAAADRYNKLWVGDWRWPEHYHLLAENEVGSAGRSGSRHRIAGLFASLRECRFPMAGP